MNGRLPRRSRPRAERGAALLTAMIIVTLVATLATAMVWQQWRAVRVEASERARTESAWILAGALDFGILILQEDQKSRRPSTDLTQPWATPLAESRLSTFLSADSNAAESDDGPEAFLSGTIADAQAKFNILNLYPKPTTDGPDAQLQVLTRLCEAVGLDGGVASRIAAGIRNASAVTAASGADSGAPLLPTTISQLTWFGIDPATATILDRYLTILPSTTPVMINANTAGKEVLAAALNIDVGSAERLLSVRQRTPFTTVAALEQNLGNVTVDKTLVDVKSGYFEVGGRLRLADHVVSQISLVQRQNDPNSRPKVLHSRLVSSIEELTANRGESK